ncbi:MAG: SPOR domain-containing protein [Saprospirales bacterium]|nr:MAG: SPOR domain-containing protein [Saprospirales bacterium]
MKRDLLFHQLYALLLQRQHIALPGLGLFMLKNYPARIDPRNDKIYPPGRAVEFLEAPGISDFYAAFFVSTSLDGGFQFWQREIEQLADEAKKLPVDGQLSLGKLGSIKRTNKGVELAKSPEEIINTLNQLPVIECKTVAVIKPSIVTSSESLKSSKSQPIDRQEPNSSVRGAVKSRTGKVNWRFWVGLLLLAVMLFLMLFYMGRDESAPDQEYEMPPHISDQRLNQPPDKFYVDTFENDTFEDRRQDPPVYRDFDNDESNYLPEDPGEQYEPEEYEEPEVEADEWIESVPESEMNQTYREEDTEKCVIVTGAFSSMSNVREMTRKLQDMGYAVYSEDIGNLTRVGAVIDCHEDQLETHLMNLQANLEPGAWILE